MKSVPLFALLIMAGTAPAANIITETFSLSTSAVIPDGDLNGLLQSLNPSTSIDSIDSITMTLNTTGGWNGDMYAYLWHDGVLSVLLNRPGRTSSLPDGSASSGMTLTLADSAATDVHLALGALSGTFQPDGRDIHPLSAFDTSPRTDSLADFASHPASGEWRLFIADTASGGQATLTSWSISITGPSSIPEPTTGLFALAAVGIASRRRRCTE